MIRTDRRHIKGLTGVWREWARQEMLDQFPNNNCIDGQDLIEWIM